MLNALLYTLLTVLGCAIFVAPAFFYRWLCWILHFPLGWIRSFFRWVNLEKLSTITLGAALILVTSLTAHATWDASPPPDSGLDKGIYEGLRIAFSVFEGDSAQFRAYMAASPLASRGVLWVWFLNACAVVLPIIIPISTVTTAAILLWNRLPHHVPIFSRNWYIFSELNPNSIRMAKSINKKLEEEWDTGVFIFLRTRRGDQSPEILDDIRTLNYYFHPKTEDRFLIWPLRRFRRMRFFFLSETTDENFERMQEFLEAVKNKWLFCPLGKPRDDVFRQELYLLSETESAPMLIDHLRDTLYKEKEVTVSNTDGTTEQKTKKVKRLVFSNTELRLLDRFRATSYDLLRNVPLHEHIHDGKLHVLILGFGKIGRDFFRTACSLGIFPDCKTEFTICDQHIGAKLNMFLSQCPELRDSVTLSTRKLNVETKALENLIEARGYHYILVALGDDERNIRVASRLKRFYRYSHWNHEARKQAASPCAPDIQPQICVNIEDSIKHDYTKKLWSEASQRDNAKSWDKGLHIFGGLDQVFTPKVLMPRCLWTAARFIHRELNSMKPDEHLNWGEYERRSSLACAVRAEYLTASNSTATPAKLADTEHLRWMAYVRSEGLRYADTNLVDVYYDRDNGRHVDILGKLTPCLTTDQTKLNSVWTHLSQGDHAADYKDQHSFRWRDEHLVALAAEIAKLAAPGK
jgi:hypothetical protein